MKKDKVGNELVNTSHVLLLLLIPDVSDTSSTEQGKRRQERAPPPDVSWPFKHLLVSRAAGDSSTMRFGATITALTKHVLMYWRIIQ